MSIVLFSMAVVFCFYKWQRWRITAIAMMAYMLEQGCPKPSERQMREYSQQVFSALFRK